MRRALHTAIILVAAAATLGGCIVEFVPDITVDHRGLLVVEGTVIDGETVIKLNQSRALLTGIGVGTGIAPTPVYGARVWVESEAGASFESVEEAPDAGATNPGTYRIRTGTLDGNTRYRVRIAALGEEYVSGWRTPQPTPEIDRVEMFTGDRDNDRVQVRLNTTGVEGGPRHYFWSYDETWEIRANHQASHYFGQYEGDYGDDHYPYSIHNVMGSFPPGVRMWRYPDGQSPFYYCWKYGGSRELLIGSTELLSANVIRDHVLFDFPVTDDRLSELYHLKVYQYSIGEDAYQYFSNQKSNTDETGSIFAPIPSEMNGNLVCTSNPKVRAIGFVEVARRAEWEIWVSDSGLYRPPMIFCDMKTMEELSTMVQESGGFWGNVSQYVPVWESDYAPLVCVDCRYGGNGTKVRPGWWPNDHY